MSHGGNRWWLVVAAAPMLLGVTGCAQEVDYSSASVSPPTHSTPRPTVTVTATPAPAPTVTVTAPAPKPPDPAIAIHAQCTAIFEENSQIFQAYKDAIGTDPDVAAATYMGFSYDMLRLASQAGQCEEQGGGSVVAKLQENARTYEHRSNQQVYYGLAEDWWPRDGDIIDLDMWSHYSDLAKAEADLAKPVNIWN